MNITPFTLSGFKKPKHVTETSIQQGVWEIFACVFPLEVNVEPVALIVGHILSNEIDVSIIVGKARDLGGSDPLNLTVRDIVTKSLIWHLPLYSVRSKLCCKIFELITRGFKFGHDCI